MLVHLRVFRACLSLCLLFVVSPKSNGLLGGDSATPHRTRRGQPLRITSTTCGFTGPWDTGGRAVREFVFVSVCCVLCCFVLCCVCACLFVLPSRLFVSVVLSLVCSLAVFLLCFVLCKC